MYLGDKPIQKNNFNSFFISQKNCDVLLRHHLEPYYLILKSNYMKNSMRVLSLIFTVLLFTNLFTSCKKDEFVKPTPEVKTTTPTTPTDVNPSTNAAKVMSLQTGGIMTSDSINYCECFSIFDEVDWDASEAEIVAQLEAILEGLTEEQLEELFTPVCTFDGEVFENACIALCNGVTDFEECDDYDSVEVDWSECFSFVYPITVVLPGAANEEVNNDEALFAAVDAWYDANPNSDEDPTLDYPVNALLVEDGSSLTITNDDELETLFEMCDEHVDDDCFTINFPISIQFPDGTVAAINSIDEGETLVEAWEDENPDSTEDVQIIYPFDVTLEDGTVVAINSEDEFDTLIDEECDGDWGGCLIEQNEPNALVKRVEEIRNSTQTQ